VKPLVSLVVAMARNRVIGAKNSIPWHLPNELKLFKSVTMGHHIVMGRKTWESIQRLLPGRTSVIVTRSRDYAVPGAIVTHSVQDAIEACEGDNEIMVIGGAEIFRETLPVADRLYLTLVDAEPDGDIVMPALDMTEWWERSSQTYAPDEKHVYGYTFYVYDRIKSRNPASSG
jgi:dihydrofolate reductase